MSEWTSSAQRWLDVQAQALRGWTLLAAAAGTAAALAFALFAFGLASVAQGWISADSSRTAAALAQALAGAVLRAACLALRDWAGLRAAALVRRRARDEVLDALAQLGPLRARVGDDGALATLAVEQVDALDAYYARYLPQRWIVATVPLLLLALIAPHSWLAALLLLATAPLIPLFMRLVGMGAAEASRQQAGALARLGAQFLDLLRGLPTLRLLAAADLGAQRLDASAQDYRRRLLSVLRLAFLSSAVLEFFASVSIALVALYLGLALLGRFDSGHYGAVPSLGSALYILLLTPEFFAPLRQLGSDYHARADALAAAEAITRLRLAVPAADAWSSTAPASNSEPAARAPAIRFDAVTLRYADGRCALDQVSLQIAAGERVALRGASGAGKSSLLALLAGFVAPSSGQIVVDGRPLAQRNRLHWWRQLAWLEQRPEWFRLSVRDNVLLGLDRNDDSRLWSALQAAGLADTVQNLPQQAESIVDAADGALSGGQLQRLALARALARDAAVWLLDEPSAHLDEDGAGHLFDALEQASRGASVILATHAQELPAWIDRVLVFEHGRLVEDRTAHRVAAGA
ncbi:ATP-binding cassette subfamily C protein CydD [Tahibacter aquaticus]|uniref:ATP-binding cassette subfamily C protein CydD n=1 Tax=Tahibacter aquaticus TaxID=520092 RepID=A0A4R6Z0B2_9GAMM|nr:thiol reductant ABC exporter subunit CydD [Tahibacter aquaticus]TDR44938.1 ATP-binding cassette subfamily C protein CydD [Tahibacter aquaticus]